ncbi:hypothetical protein DYB37_010907 [Aphanomyces astaci]|uniref:JmjC domain-containing protein n=2 Tax=Aphanomyces astaci TaxID=112090 RepID=A0A418FGZ1_APHAT|nr:hypothetical protein DYB35_010683 [Aphanomyces astaci]RHZ29232.1 hypothetical protein DYB37_010907 [Aphanomyces astaci]
MVHKKTCYCAETMAAADDTEAYTAIPSRGAIARRISAASTTVMTSAPGVLCPEFHPTPEEFSCFATYVRTIVEPACHHIGMCKIVPPTGFFSRTYNDLEFTIPTPLTQYVAGKKGVFHVDLVTRKSMSLDAFRALAAAASPNDIDDPALDSILRTWVDLPGITQAMLYFGMWSAMFALHTEDMELYSINYLHTGSPKVWYTVPPAHASRVERVCQTMFPHEHMACHECVPHNVTLDMDLFLTQLFKASRPGSRALTSDDWVFSCVCLKFASSADPSVVVEAKVVAVDGAFVRVHFKGEACATDEWIASTSSAIVEGSSPTPPAKKRRPSSVNKTPSTLPKRRKHQPKASKSN